MFDAEQRLIVVQQAIRRFVRIERKTQTRPGTTLREMLEHRVTHRKRAEGTIMRRASSRNRTNEISLSKPYQFSSRLRDGRYVSVVHRPLAEGGWVSTHEDVTEATRREESFRLLFEGNPVPMWVYDRESLQFWRSTTLPSTHYGYSREQFLTMAVPDFRRPEDRERLRPLLRTLRMNRNSRKSIGQHCKADGNVIDVSTSVRAP